MDALLGRVYAHRTHAVQSTMLSNGIAERWVGICRREILDHVIALDQRHWLRLMRNSVSDYHQDRIHDSLERNTPHQRAIERQPAATANVTSLPRLGGLHHRYAWREAA
jgi:hypothetical protein